MVWKHGLIYKAQEPRLRNYITVQFSGNERKARPFEIAIDRAMKVAWKYIRRETQDVQCKEQKERIANQNTKTKERETLSSAKEIGLCLLCEMEGIETNEGPWKESR